MNVAHEINMRGMLGPEVLIGGIPTRGAGLCYVYARELLLRVGVTLPERSEDLLADETAFGVPLGSNEPLHPGDVLVLKGNGIQHLAVAINGYQAAHHVDELGGVVMRVAVLERTGRIIRRCRPRALMDHGGGQGDNT